MKLKFLKVKLFNWHSYQVVCRVHLYELRCYDTLGQWTDTNTLTKPLTKGCKIHNDKSMMSWQRKTGLNVTLKRWTYCIWLHIILPSLANVQKAHMSYFYVLTFWQGALLVSLYRIIFEKFEVFLCKLFFTDIKHVMNIQIDNKFYRQNNTGTYFSAGNCSVSYCVSCTPGNSCLHTCFR